MHTRSPRPTLCAIIGVDGSGNQRLARAIAERLGPERCTRLSLDDYVLPHDAAPTDPPARAPSDQSLALMAQHLRLLRQGETVFKPVVNHASGRFLAPEFVRPTPVILAHGRHGLASPELRSLWDASVFVDGASGDAVTPRDVLAQRERADLIVCARLTAGGHARGELRIARPVPLPTLAHVSHDAAATVLHVSSAAAGPDVIAVDGGLEAVREVLHRLVADYVVARTAPRDAFSPAAVRSAHPVPGA